MDRPQRPCANAGRTGSSGIGERTSDLLRRFRGMNRSRRFLIRMVLFLVLVAALVVALGRQLVNAFMGNPGVNGVILGILLAGIAYIFRQVLLLDPEIDWIENIQHDQASDDDAA